MNAGKAWFWSSEGVALFVGRSGAKYPKCYEIEPCREMTYGEAADVFTRQVSPYALAMIPKGRISTLYFKTIWECLGQQ